MTDDELRLKIAELLGWTFQKESWYDEEGVDGTRAISPTGEEYTAFGWDADCDIDEFQSIGEHYANIPNWTQNIADAYELEAGLTDPHEIHEYCRAMNRLVNRADKESGYANTGFDTRWWFLHATPRQRCEAWLMVKEGKNE